MPIDIKEVSVKNGGVIKEFEELEFEVKFDFAKKEFEPLSHLQAIEAFFESNDRYRVDRVQTRSEMQTYFFSGPDAEFSVFRYEGEVMLKIKSHQIVQIGKYPVFKNDEKFLYNMDEISGMVTPADILFVGSMRKRRAKDFILDLVDGRVYSLAITICDLNGNEQHQLEIEYFGFIEAIGARDQNSEDEILSRLLELCDYVHGRSEGMLSISNERKYDFVQRSLPANGPGMTKDKLLQNLSVI